jgi:PadR family transcriptional regulator PadR
MDDKQLQNLILELRRGLIPLVVLLQLRQEHYGYSLIKVLGEQGLDVDQGTLYPLLRRLETAGMLVSEWRVDGPRPRRYYQASREGEELLEALTQEWTQLVGVVEGMLS